MKKILLATLLSCGLSTLFAQPVVGFSPFINTGLTKPTDIVNAKDNSGRLFFVQQNGIIRVYAGGTLQATPFLDISSLITFDNNGERGLLSLAFHPSYSTNGYFFVYYNNAAGNVTLAQYHVSTSNTNVADFASGKILLTITKPFTNHNGCKLNFGPDGNLYFGTGDGGSGGDPNNNAQNGNSLLGKMIRINVDNFNTPPYYTVPASNPFVGNANYLPEIYATGLRNPWRWSFDRQTNDMWLPDVGQSAWEEVNFLPLAQTAGANFGWRCYEGTHDYNLSTCGTTPATGKTFPIFEYPHTATGGYSITGGYVYRAAEFPTLQGYYICCDYLTTNGWLIKPTGTGTYNVYQQTNFPANIVSFGEAEDGTLYAASLNGPIYKVIVSGALPVKLLSFSGRWANGKDQLFWETSVDPSLDYFELEQSANGTRFQTVDRISSISNGSTAKYQSGITNISGDNHFYRLKIVYKDGNITYSAVLKIGGKLTDQVLVNYNNGQLQLTSSQALQAVAIYNVQGQKITSFANLSAGSYVLNTPRLTSGVYLVRSLAADGNAQQSKIFVP